MIMKLLYLLVGCFVFTGCASRESSSLRYRPISVYLTGRMNIESYKAPPLRNAFQAREQVVAVVKSTDSKERMVLVEFLNAETGNVVSKQVVSCHPGRLRYCGPTALFPAGSYVVKVSLDGVLLDAQNFSIYGY